MNYVASVMNTSNGKVPFSAVIFPNTEGFLLLLDMDSAVRFFDKFSSLDEAKTKAVAWFNRRGVPIAGWK